jgi:uncharacterized membrane protein
MDSSCLQNELRRRAVAAFVGHHGNVVEIGGFAFFVQAIGAARFAVPHLEEVQKVELVKSKGKSEKLNASLNSYQSSL